MAQYNNKDITTYVDTVLVYCWNKLEFVTVDNIKKETAKHYTYLYTLPCASTLQHFEFKYSVIFKIKWCSLKNTESMWHVYTFSPLLTSKML